MSVKFEPSKNMTYNRKRLIVAKFAENELLKKACDACSKQTRNTYFCNSEKYRRNCFYEYLSKLSPEKQDKYYQQVLASDKRSMEPCCEFCLYNCLHSYEDIPGSHLAGFWEGECSHFDSQGEISSSCYTSPKWCPIRKIDNFKPKDWMLVFE